LREVYFNNIIFFNFHSTPCKRGRVRHTFSSAHVQWVTPVGGQAQAATTEIGNPKCSTQLTP